MASNYNSLNVYIYEASDIIASMKNNFGSRLNNFSAIEMVE